MCATQKFAWFNLLVVGLTLTSVAVLVPFLGKGALGGLGFMGLMGFGPLFFRRRPGQIVADERDALIQKRSWIVAYALFWVAYVGAAVGLCPVLYGEKGVVPVEVVQLSVAFGFLFVYAVASVAMLAQYAGGPKNAD